MVVPGDPRNLKVTGPADLMIAAALLETLSRERIRVGLGYDVHPFADDGRARAGPRRRDASTGAGLAGHSDADAVCHAVADALLGPAGLPDLGSLFPASDDTYRDASSLELLRDVVDAGGAPRAGRWSTSTSSSPPRSRGSRRISTRWSRHLGAGARRRATSR